MENIEEIWKDIVGCEGHYQVSNIGNIRSLKSKLGYRILRLSYRGEYLCARGYVNRKVCKIPAHRAVAMAFIHNPLNKPQVNHINGIKLDNRVENLEWCTNAENMAHAVNTGLIKCRGEQQNLSKLTKEQVLKIRELSSQGMSSRKIVKEMAIVGKTAIRDILIGKTWKHI